MFCIKSASVCVCVGRHDRRLMSSTKGVCSRAVCICGLGGGVDVVEEGCRPIRPKQGANEGESERERRQQKSTADSR